MLEGTEDAAAHGAVPGDTRWGLAAKSSVSEQDGAGNTTPRGSPNSQDPTDRRDFYRKQQQNEPVGTWPQGRAQGT